MAVSFDRRTLLKAFGASAGLGMIPNALAQLRIEISGVGANQIPIALQTLNGSNTVNFDLMRIVAADLSRTGDFRLIEASNEPTIEE